ncbi:MAG: GIY-YIG nuclease family protein [Patescibacteria group bacterium]
MYTVYVLEDESGRYYKGMTMDFERRLKEHQRGQTKTTRSMMNLRVVFVKIFEKSSEARDFEIYLKTAAGRRFLQKQLEY